MLAVLLPVVEPMLVDAGPVVGPVGRLAVELVVGLGVGPGVVVAHISLVAVELERSPVGPGSKHHNSCNLVVGPEGTGLTHQYIEPFVQTDKHPKELFGVQVTSAIDLE